MIAYSTFYGTSRTFGWSSLFHVVQSTKEYEEIFRTFLSSINIECPSKIYKKSWYLLFLSSSDLQTEQPRRKVFRTKSLIKYNILSHFEKHFSFSHSHLGFVFYKNKSSKLWRKLFWRKRSNM